MSASEERPISASDLISLGRPYWLPPVGYGNGMDALFWTQLARLPHADADLLLHALAEQRLPGWIAPVDRHHPESDEALYDVWTATTDIDTAEDIVMTLMNAAREEGHPPEPDPPEPPPRHRPHARARSRSRSEP